MEDCLDEISGRIEELPALPAVSRSILERMADENASNRETARLVESNQSHVNGSIAGEADNMMRFFD